MLQLWRYSRTGTPYAHEEGETFYGFRNRGAGRYSGPSYWKPGDTLDEAAAAGELPTATAIPLRDTPGVNTFVQAHTHPWPEGTAFVVRGVPGVQHMASGPSVIGDESSNMFSNQRLNGTVIDYTSPLKESIEPLTGSQRELRPWDS